jgi:uncharacterized membrane protein YagU involved in acid resistance
MLTEQQKIIIIAVVAVLAIGAMAKMCKKGNGKKTPPVTPPVTPPSSNVAQFGLPVSMSITGNQHSRAEPVSESLGTVSESAVYGESFAPNSGGLVPPKPLMLRLV